MISLNSTKIVENGQNGQKKCFGQLSCVCSTRNLVNVYYLLHSKLISHFFFKIENAVTKSDRLSGIDENTCILHGNI